MIPTRESRTPLPAGAGPAAGKGWEGHRARRSADRKGTWLGPQSGGSEELVEAALSTIEPPGAKGGRGEPGTSRGGCRERSGLRKQKQTKGLTLGLSERRKPPIFWSLIHREKLTGTKAAGLLLLRRLLGGGLGLGRLLRSSFLGSGHETDLRSLSESPGCRIHEHRTRTPPTSESWSPQAEQIARSGGRARAWEPQASAPQPLRPSQPSRAHPSPCDVMTLSSRRLTGYPQRSQIG